jgi:WD40 repeat protein
MKLLVVRLLVPPALNAPAADTASYVTQASQARAELALQDREEAAIMINVNTMSPQTVYSTPRLAWRPDGSGVYVSSDDGIIRGFEASTGKLISSLNAHEPGSKIRCLWAGNNSTMAGKESESKPEFEPEYLLSGGFDQRLVLWKSP